MPILIPVHVTNVVNQHGAFGRRKYLLVSLVSAK